MTPARFDELRANAESDTNLLSPSDVIECLDEIARLAAIVYVPGSFFCPKCRFSLTKSVLYAKSGNIGVDHHCDENCPNDGTVMEPVTWEADARKMSELMPELARLRRLGDAFALLRILVQRQAFVGSQIQIVERWLLANDPDYVKPRSA